MTDENSIEKALPKGASYHTYKDSGGREMVRVMMFSPLKVNRQKLAEVFENSVCGGRGVILPDEIKKFVQMETNIIPVELGDGEVYILTCCNGYEIDRIPMKSGSQESGAKLSYGDLVPVVKILGDTRTVDMPMEELDGVGGKFLRDYVEAVK